MKKNFLSLVCSLKIISLTVIILLVMSACGAEDEVDNSQYYLDAPTEVIGTLQSK